MWANISKQNVWYSCIPTIHDISQEDCNISHKNKRGATKNIENISVEFDLIILTETRYLQSPSSVNVNGYIFWTKMTEF